NRGAVHSGIAGYVGVILGLSAVLMAVALWMLWRPDAWPAGIVLFLLLFFFPATELVTALINRAITWNFGAVVLPGLDLTKGIPANCRTLVAIPALLTSEAELLAHVEQLEVHYLSGAGGDLTYALLIDRLDSDEEYSQDDAQLLAKGAAALAQLNLQHGPGPAGSRFLLLYRRSVFNKAEGKWMGWERKRGKLHELNRLLRGATDTNFVPIEGLSFQVPADVRYVITLDADTRLPRDAAQRLIGKMAHPLNRPRLDPALQRVVNGHGILQPRVTPSLPLHREGSIYQRLFSSPAGLDPYAAAVSDVYQDLFGEGSYT